MAVTKVLARDYIFELNTGTSETPSWVEINGVNSWSDTPQAVDADTTTFDEGGRQSHLKASRGNEFGLQGLILLDEADASRDPGQEAAETWADQIGPASLKEFRITDPAGGTYTMLASATVTRGGGGNDDPSAWNLAVKCSGTITYDDGQA